MSSRPAHVLRDDPAACCADLLTADANVLCGAAASWLAYRKNAHVHASGKTETNASGSAISLKDCRVHGTKTRPVKDFLLSAAPAGSSIPASLAAKRAFQAA